MNTHYLTQLPPDWEQTARIFAALGDGTRQKMLLLFEADETISLKTLVELLPLSRSAVVHHITVLEQAGLLVARRQGREVGYSLNTAPLMSSLEDVLNYAKNLGNASPTSPSSPHVGTTAQSAVDAHDKAHPNTHADAHTCADSAVDREGSGDTHIAMTQEADHG